MTPAARVQTAIELLDAIIEAARHKGAPADRILADWFRANRFAGSKDRRAIRELVYAAIRACGPVPESGRAAMLRLGESDTAIAPLFDGSQYGPAPIALGETAARGGVAPDWLTERLRASDIGGEDATALLGRAPLDLRVNVLVADRATIDLPEPGAPLAAPQALRFEAGTGVEQWPHYRDGRVEIQDHGSQLAYLAIAAEPGETIVDLCAGAGGKSLAIAAHTANGATIVAADTDARRLGNLAPRARRAGARIAHTVLLDPGRELEGLEPWIGMADRVLVDAPCSGTGTWRRNPEARWRLDKAGLARLVDTQVGLLDIAAKLLRPGGSLIYVVCSLLDEEGAGQFDAFLARHADFVPSPVALPLGTSRGHGIRLTPARDDTDGFFIARAAPAC